MVRWTSKPTPAKVWGPNQKDWLINQYMDVMFFRRYWVSKETYEIHLEDLEREN